MSDELLQLQGLGPADDLMPEPAEGTHWASVLSLWCHAS